MNSHPKKEKKFLFRLFLSVFSLLFLLVFSLVVFEITYAYKMYPFVYVGNLEVTGKTKNQSIEYLISKTDLILSNGLNFVFDDKKINIDSVITGSGGNLFEEIFSYDVQQTVNKAYDIGHTGGWTKRIKDQFDALFNKQKTPIDFRLNKEGLKVILQDNFTELEKPAINASFDVKIESNNVSVNIKDEVAGEAFDYDQAIEDVYKNLLELKNQDIVLKKTTDQPKIIKNEVRQVLGEIKDIIMTAPITFAYDDETWELSKVELASWLALEKNNDKIAIVIDNTEASVFFEIIADDIKIESLDAKFEMVDGRVSQFQSNKNGLELDFEKTIELLSIELLEKRNNNIELKVLKIESKVKNGDINDLGIIEMIGRGVSDFSGSPANRIHNITNGAKAINGLLIAPGETFSMIKTLGDIDAENGYLPELVIKGNKTIPEYGGGLCQVGTTAFRVALQAGLPIVERRSHSYNVSYYAPTGTDATIYGPHPDMRFKNDTGKHLLFLARIEGVKLIFELWGTKDGRSIKFIGKEEVDSVSKLVPIVYNLVRPGKPKYIETDTLEPGQTKKLESSHTGADAKFDYIVNYSNGEVVEETFLSHYIPWREVWLIGAEKTEENTENIDDKEEAEE